MAAVDSRFIDASSAPVGLPQVPLALLAPRRVFGRVEDVPAYGWALVVLLVLMGLSGYATVQTGLIDREAERRFRAGVAELEKQQLDITQRSVLKEQIDEAREASEFARLITRWTVVFARPIAALATILLLAAVFYAIVALTGHKPEWHTLLTVMVFASYADVLAEFTRLGLMIRFESMEVNTSLAALVRFIKPEEFLAMVRGTGQPVSGFEAMAPLALLSGLLTALDPFRIWFWVLVTQGLRATAQLRGWKVWLICPLFWMIAAGMRGLGAVAQLQAAAGVEGM